MAKYQEAMKWIAENDGPGDPESLDVNHVSSMVTVLLVADIFKKIPRNVAGEIIKYRLFKMGLGDVTSIGCCKCVICGTNIPANELKYIRGEFKDCPAHKECFDEFDDADAFLEFVKIKKS